jgi:hypothetical protein
MFADGDGRAMSWKVGGVVDEDVQRCRLKKKGRMESYERRKCDIETVLGLCVGVKQARSDSGLVRDEDFK